MWKVGKERLDMKKLRSFNCSLICVLQDVTSNLLAEDDAISETSVADISRFIPKMPPSPSISHIISIGQLMESVNSLPGLTTKLMLRDIDINTLFLSFINIMNTFFRHLR